MLAAGTPGFAHPVPPPGAQTRRVESNYSKLSFTLGFILIGSPLETRERWPWTPVMCMIRGIRSWLRGNCILLWLIPSSLVYCTSCGAAPGVRGAVLRGPPSAGRAQTARLRAGAEAGAGGFGGGRNGHDGHDDVDDEKQRQYDLGYIINYNRVIQPGTRAHS